MLLVPFLVLLWFRMAFRIPGIGAGLGTSSLMRFMSRSGQVKMASSGRWLET